MPYKKRTQYLIAGSITFLFIVYWFAIRKTIELKQNIEQSTLVTISVDSATERLNDLQNKINFIDHKLRRYLFDDSCDQKYVLHLVSDFCSKNNLILTSFPQTISEAQKEFLLETTVFSVRGSVQNHIKLIYHFEQTLKMGRISSVILERELDHTTQKKYLTCTIFLQNIRKK